MVDWGWDGTIVTARVFAQKVDGSDIDMDLVKWMGWGMVNLKLEL
jgi:hypothetical protein